MVTAKGSVRQGGLSPPAGGKGEAGGREVPRRGPGGKGGRAWLGPSGFPAKPAAVPALRRPVTAATAEEEGAG